MNRAHLDDEAEALQSAAQYLGDAAVDLQHPNKHPCQRAMTRGSYQ
jgi:hypothetical protein